MGSCCSVGQFQWERRKRFWRRGWRWGHKGVNVLNATELHIKNGSNGLKW